MVTDSHGHEMDMLRLLDYEIGSASNKSTTQVMIFIYGIKIECRMYSGPCSLTTYLTSPTKAVIGNLEIDRMVARLDKQSYKLI